MSLYRLLAVIAAAAFFAGGAYSLTDAQAQAVTSRTITATLVGADGKQAGNVQLTQDASGKVTVIVGVSGLKPGQHGIHIHAVGICEAPGFATAGGHFNAAAKAHGLSNPQGHHSGDLPNLTAEANGTARYEQVTSDITFADGATNSIFDADGSALVIHADPDDQVTDPSGNSGTRVACAVLAAPRPAASVTTVPRPPTAGGAFGDDGAALDARAGALLALTLALTAGGLLMLRARRSRS